MKIDVSELLGKKAFKKDIEYVLPNTEINNVGETIRVVEPIEVSCSLCNIGDIIYVDGNIKGKIELTCSRCLDKFDYEVVLEMHEKFTTEPDNRDDEVVFINKDKIDLSEIVLNNILISLPMQILCKENCKGLCQHCGINLNYDSCNCDNEDIDPRLAKLKELFSNN